LVLAAVAAGGLAGAQDQPAAETPLPKEPLVPRAPLRCDWTVRITEDFDSDWQDSDSWEKQADIAPVNRTIKSLEFSKDADLQTFRVRTAWSDGEKLEEWIVMGNHVAERAGNLGLYIVGAEGLLARDLRTSDFPELGWIDMSNYKGVKVFKGRLAFLFQADFDKRRLGSEQQRLLAFAQQKNPKLTPSELFKPKVKEVIAYLDAATQLPILFNDGTTIRRYTFSEPSDIRLRPPIAILEFLRDREAALKARLTPPSGPAGPDTPENPDTPVNPE
jgi:hypothetical protein